MYWQGSAQFDLENFIVVFYRPTIAQIVSLIGNFRLQKVYLSVLSIYLPDVMTHTLITLILLYLETLGFKGRPPSQFTYRLAYMFIPFISPIGCHKSC
jgi:hypothetical protein